MNTQQMTLSEQVAYFKKQRRIEQELQKLLGSFFSEDVAFATAVLIMDNFRLENK